MNKLNVQQQAGKDDFTGEIINILLKNIEEFMRFQAKKQLHICIELQG